MSYKFEEKLVSSTKYNIKCPYQMTPKYVVIHDTANLASAYNEIAYMTRNNNQVSFHLAVDEEYAIQGLPFNRNAWAAGDGGNGDGNRNGIHVEICRPTHSNRDLYDKAEENAVYVAARLLYKFNLNISKLKKHQDFSGKKCPNVILTENRWESIKERVDWVLSKIKSGEIDADLASGTTTLKSNNSSQTVTNPSQSSFQVGDKVTVKKSATHYATGEKIADFVKGSTYEISKIKDNKLLLSDITSWVWDYDVEGLQKNFRVEIICDELNIRESASFDSRVVGTVLKGEVFTIVDEKNGLYKLKSGAGWISAGAKYVKKL